MLLSTLLSGKAAVVAFAAAGAVTLGGGTAVAAYTGALPAGLQQVAHDTIGAPPASAGSASPAALQSAPTSRSTSSTDTTSTDPSMSPAPAASASPVGPDATGPAAFGLCTAFAHGGLPSSSVAYRNLAAAASGWATSNDPAATAPADQIAAYCTTIAHPGASPSPTQQPNAAASGQPSPVPSGKPSFAPVGPPSAHPSGKPSFAPVGPPVRQ